MALEVIIEDVSIDLFEDTNFYITEQIHDLTDLQTRNASFTKVLSVPLTELNKSVLQNTFPVINGQLVPPTKLRCNILMSGVPVILDGFTSGGIREDESINLIFYFESFEFFDNLKGTISELSWNDLNFTFDPAGWNSNKANTTGLVTALAFWLDSINFNQSTIPSTSSLNLEHDLNFSGFHIYFREILTRIVEQNGFSFDDDDMVAVQDYTTLALACPVNKFALSLDITNPIIGDVERSAEQFENTQAVHRIEFDSVQVDPFALWNAGLFQWDFTSTAAINIEITIDGEHTRNGNRTSSIDVIKNDTIIESVDISELNELNLSITVTTDIISGDFLAVQVDLDNNSTIAISIGSDFVINEAGFQQSRDINIADYIPQMDVKTFFRSVMKYFNAVITTNDDTKTVKIFKFNDIKTNEEQDLTANLDTSKTISEASGLPYFQESTFKYLDSRARRTDTEAVFLFNDDILEQKGVLVELDFGFSDNAAQGTLFIRTNPTIEIPNYEFEAFNDVGLNHTAATNTFTLTGVPQERIRVGDYIESTSLVGGQFRDMGRVTQITPTFVIESTWAVTGVAVDWRLYRYKENTVDNPRISNIVASQGDYNVYNGSNNTRAIVQNGLETRFSDSMFGDTLRSAHYDDMLNALNPAKVIQAIFLFTPQEFKNIDLAKPVYLKNFGNTFFINKNEQYRENQPNRMTLIAI
jgi:hypothetical protein